jgi:ribosomal protein S18 acetylase RimI-like enzyme
MKSSLTVTELLGSQVSLHASDLSDVLQSCVSGGASVGFLSPLTHEKAMSYWLGLVPAIGSGTRRLLVARWNDELVGTVQVALGMPDNGQHRAEIAKLLVHSKARRQGVARALMEAAEQHARSCGRTLLILDTRRGDAAESLYNSLGYQLAGVIPGYARSTTGELTATSFMYKVL